MCRFIENLKLFHHSHHPRINSNQNLDPCRSFRMRSTRFSIPKTWMLSIWACRDQTRICLTVKVAQNLESCWSLFIFKPGFTASYKERKIMHLKIHRKMKWRCIGRSCSYETKRKRNGWKNRFEKVLRNGKNLDKIRWRNQQLKHLSSSKHSKKQRILWKENKKPLRK